METGRRSGTIRSGVVAGSVWESRMKIDEVKGGVKVFNGEDNSEENVDNASTGLQVNRRSRTKQTSAGSSGKRKMWKSQSVEGFDRSPIQISKQRSELSNNLAVRTKELSVSADGIKKGPMQIKKTRSEVCKELSVSVDGIERSPKHKMKTRSEEAKEICVSVDGIQRGRNQIRKSKSELCKEAESGNGIERNSIQLRKVKSESNKALDESVDGNEGNSAELRKVTSISKKALDKSGRILDRLDDGTEGDSVEPRMEKLDSNKVDDEFTKDFNGSVEGTEKTGADEICKEFNVCREKVMSSSLSNVGQVKSAPQLVMTDDDSVDGDEEDWDEELEEELDEEIEIEKKTLEIKETIIPEEQPKKVVIEEKKFIQDQKKEEKKFNQIHKKEVPISPIVKRQPPPVSSIYPNSAKTTKEFERVPETHNKLQSLADLAMWRDVSKSAFIFGIGTFCIISSSYSKDLNISLITVISYLGLIYLAAIFLYRSIICRGAIYIDDTNQGNVLGEEEAIWLLKLVLPYLNEFLLKLRALFSGDPATTMKLAVLLFVLARCGSSITIWKMTKMAFFGVFTIPKVCSSYSTQLTAYGKFWVQRFQDAWDSCSHKKAVAFSIFTLVWNLSSIVARIWSVFMLFVAFRYYQQSLMSDDWVVEEEVEDSWQGQVQEEAWAQFSGNKESKQRIPSIPNKVGKESRYI